MWCVREQKKKKKRWERGGGGGVSRCSSDWIRSSILDKRIVSVRSVRGSVRTSEKVRERGEKGQVAGKRVMQMQTIKKEASPV